ncbi:MAG: hypothetical protein ACYCVL_09005 [Gemmatimonadaceae bacterium]
MIADDAGTRLPLSMNDAMTLVRYAVSMEAASAHEAETRENTAAIRKLARRIQNEATTGASGAYTAHDVAMIEALTAQLGPSAERIAAALRTRVG